MKEMRDLYCSGKARSPYEAVPGRHDEFGVNSVVVKLATYSPIASTHVDDGGARRVNAGPREAVDEMFDFEGIQIGVGNEHERFC
jgi:hypothetical protein